MSAISAEPVRIEAWSDWSSWQQTRETEVERFNAEYRARLSAMAEAADRGWSARCTACGRDARFSVPAQGAGQDEAHREHLTCPHCRLNGRARAAMAIVDAEPLDPASAAWITEHGTPAWRQLRRRFPIASGSEFHPSRRALARRVLHRLRFGAVPHRDLLATGLAPSSLDLILCLDVLEHIEDIDRALGECSRVLRPGGLLVATMPFDENAPRDRQLAQADGRGGLLWLGEAEWHHDPLGARIPCFHRFGWTLLQRAQAAGLSKAQWCRVNEPKAALFGLWVFRARR